MRRFTLLLGFLFTGLGFLGSFLPVLPATPFFLLAAYFFSRSSPRLEAWVLNLPQVGPVVRDYRAGRGIPLRAKALATALALLGAFLSLLRLPHPLAQALVVGLIAYGVYFIWKKVPTKTPTGQGR
ncbi:hypothetical protein Theos_1054 [Thermus oshimai JL-2]|uniref:DUF454 domain-containing protein n=1 Tax=Thermus oshimai JL-2 TaxID=751945 RepID=K7R578_THEOS|nr:YbaN family protein [Thermus oshimai]AFV76104.1 hypothetical protein Theos_1054 [Thermus oshimai JL-2]